MKRLLLILMLIIGPLCIWSVISGRPSSNDGIQFYEGSWSSALQKAKTENKPIFLDIYASWCGPCKMLKKKSFTDKQVGNFFNASYVNVSLDGEKGDGKILAEKFRITGYPSLIILDK